MLSLAKLGRGREDYYLRSVGADASQYYSERGEVAGAWVGGGAEVLGLRGQVQDQALLAVLAGYEPSAGGIGRCLMTVLTSETYETPTLNHPVHLMVQL